MTTTAREDAPYQPVLRRRDSAWRYAVVIAVGALQLMQFTKISAVWLGVDVALALAALISLRYRRRWPLPVTVGIMAASIVSTVAFGPMALAIVSVSTRRRWRELAAVGAAALVCFFVSSRLPLWEYPEELGPPPSFLESFAWNMGIIAVLVAWGLYIGSRRELLWTVRERADRLEREQESLTEQARDAERAQIAREMHDVLAHRISQISMQAGAIAFRTDLDADELRSSAHQLQVSANAALDDLRVVLGVLRDPESGNTLDTPQPRAEDIDALIESARAEGMRIVADIQLDPALDETIGRTVYRITQECITNARKHAPGTVLSMRIASSPETGVDIEMSNPIPLTRGTTSLPPSGFGLVGLTERAELAGGTLAVSTSPTDFVVSCHLPWHADHTALPHEYAQ